jgi:hypothetical protein
LTRDGDSVRGKAENYFNLQTNSPVESTFVFAGTAYRVDFGLILVARHSLQASHPF